MSVYEYKTLIVPGEGLYKEKGSKFIAFAYPVHSIEQVEERLLALRKEFYDARHHCYAYRLNPDADLYRANDDGEPNHSAGDPILGQLKSFELTNTLIVVIRYFGGTKLGVSGLINAYKTAAADALSQATIKTLQVKQTISLHFDYPATNEVMKLLDKYKAEIQDQKFDTDCTIRALIPLKKLGRFQKDAQLLVDLGSQITLKIIS
jgi:uncharacterized YigZ family protein